jgi:hypothetical protein
MLTSQLFGTRHYELFHLLIPSKPLSKNVTCMYVFSWLLVCNVLLVVNVAVRYPPRRLIGEWTSFIISYRSAVPIRCRSEFNNLYWQLIIY